MRKAKEFAKGILKMIPDALYLKLKYRLKMGKALDLENPKTFNEKLQWLKLNNRNPKHRVMVDKYLAKTYIAEKIGEQYVIKLLGVWDDPNDIDFDKLPEQFVLKLTHNSGSVFICTDKRQFDFEHVLKQLRKGMKENYYYHSREWQYKDLKPRIIAEEYMVDESGDELKDYKIFTFNGEPYCVQVDFNRFKGHKKNLYSTNWELLEFSFNYPAHPEIQIPRPHNLEEMLEIARKLGAGEPYVRVDFYSVNGKTYVGEITFYPASGFGKFVPDGYDRILGNKIHLPPM